MRSAIFIITLHAWDNVGYIGDVIVDSRWEEVQEVWIVLFWEHDKWDCKLRNGRPHAPRWDDNHVHTFLHSNNMADNCLRNIYIHIYKKYLKRSWSLTVWVQTQSVEAIIIQFIMNLFLPANFSSHYLAQNTSCFLNLQNLYESGAYEIERCVSLVSKHTDSNWIAVAFWCKYFKLYYKVATRISIWNVCVYVYVLIYMSKRLCKMLIVWSLLLPPLFQFYCCQHDLQIYFWESTYRKFSSDPFEHTYI